MRPFSALVLLSSFAAFLLVLGFARAQACPITIRHIEPRSRDVIAPVGTHPPYLKITYHNDSSATIVRIEFEAHFAGALGEFTSNHPVRPGSGEYARVAGCGLH